MRWIRHIITLLVLIGASWYIAATWPTMRKTLLGFDVRYTLPMLVVPILMLAANGLIGRNLAAEFGVKLGVAEWYALAMVNAFGNYLPFPQAGALARGVYLKRTHRLAYPLYAASLVVTYVSSLAISGMAGLAALGGLALKGQWAPWPLWAVFGLLAASVILFTPAMSWLPLPGRLASFRQGLDLLRGRRVLLGVVLLQIALVGLTATGLYLACQALPDGKNVSWPMALMMGLMIMASGLINLTPGNVGIEQGAAEFTGRMLAVPANVGFAASALFRAMAVIVVFVATPVCWLYLARRMARAQRTVEQAPESARIV